MQTVDSLVEKLDYLAVEQREVIRRAYYFAEEAHEGQYRRSGDPYIVHPLAVGKILADMHMDSQSVQAALLHDVIEDTHVSKEALAEAFARYEHQFSTYGFEPIRTEWLARAAKLGEVITARTANSETEGTFETVDANGNLVLNTAKGRVSIPAADIFF